MTSILDNPIWAALCSENRHLGAGNENVKLFNAEVAPFAGLSAYSPEKFRELYQLVQPGQVVVLFYPQEHLDIALFEPVVKVPGYQMIFEGTAPDLIQENNPVALTEKDVPEMRSLTQLAQPGPFVQRTIDFGGYQGIFDNKKLIAMGGQRLQLPGFTEISAVCTHPEYSGQGLARKVVNRLIMDILAAGNTPYLHVRADNDRAIALYQRMGFAIRTEMYFHVIKRS